MTDDSKALGPEILADALQDRIHTASGRLLKATSLQPPYDFEFEAKRLVDALKLEGATMTLICSLHEAYDAGAKNLIRAEATVAKYQELLYAVGNKHSGESRHETALRYIRNAEESNGPASQERS